MRGTMPRWMFWTSPGNVKRVIVGSGGRIQIAFVHGRRAGPDLSSAIFRNRRSD
jgi:hypothetical protein